MKEQKEDNVSLYITTKGSVMQKRQRYVVEELVTMLACCPSQELQRIIVHEPHRIILPDSVRYFTWEDFLRDPEDLYPLLLCSLAKLLPLYCRVAWLHAFYAYACVGLGIDAEQEGVEAIALHPLKPMYHRILGDIYVFSGRHEDAIDAYTQALTLTSNPLVYVGLCVAYLLAAEKASDEEKPVIYGKALQASQKCGALKGKIEKMYATT